MSVNKVNSDGSLLRVAGGILYADSPIGTIIPFGGSAIPNGYLLCNGAEVLKTAYAELYAVIGDAFGMASDNTKFKLPDLREAVPKGAGLSGKSNNHYDSDGVALGEFIEDRIQDHRHEVSVIPQSGGSQYIAGCSGGAISKSLTDYVDTTIATSTRKGVTTEVKAVGVKYIIKAKQVAVPADFLAKVDEAVEDVYGDIIPSDASASNKLITVADRASFTKTIHTTAKTQSDWHTLGNINVSDIPSGNYLVSLKSSPDVQSQNISCLLQLGSSMIAMSMNGGTTQMLSCPKVINKRSATTLNVALYLGQGSTIQEGDFVIRFDRVN